MFDAELIQRFQNQETPFYHYDLGLLKKTLTQVKTLAAQADYQIHYAVKANANQTILQTISQAGFGADCVSGNEIKAALNAGFSGSKLLFAGVGKTDREINFALSQDIFLFNCESLQELTVINQLAGNQNRKARVALRVNPNIDAKTHHYITTGLNENKFGINQGELNAILEILPELKNLELVGLHFHIGSQITDLSVFKGLCLRANQIQSWFSQQGYQLQHINLGGGLGVDYFCPDQSPIADFAGFFALIRQFLHRQPKQQVHFELGRSLVAQCGSLISRVTYLKKGETRNFVILDAGMTELMRPALYQSYHQIDNLTSQGQTQEYDVVGPICESSDCFGKAVKLPQTRRGDLVAIRSAGAYGEVMGSRYNLRDQNPPLYTQDTW